MDASLQLITALPIFCLRISYTDVFISSSSSNSNPNSSLVSRRHSLVLNTSRRVAEDALVEDGQHAASRTLADLRAHGREVVSVGGSRICCVVSSAARSLRVKGRNARGMVNVRSPQSRLASPSTSVAQHWALP